METLVWILQAVPHAIFITGLIVAGHWAIKKIIKAVKEYDNVWGTKGFCCKFEDGCKAVYVMANRVFRRKTRQYLKLVKNGREIE